MLQLLTSFYPEKPKYLFHNADTKLLFEKNLLEQPESWSWRNRSISYTLNSQGFRCGQFDSLDWNNSIVCFGCSNTFGVGVDDSDTWPQVLNRLAQVPVINLSQGGQGCGFNWVNSVRVIAAGHKPRAAIYYWPDPIRMFTLSDPNNLNLVKRHGPWDMYNDQTFPDIQLGLLWAQDSLLGVFWAEQYLRSLDIMWGQLGVPVLHTTWSQDFKVPRVDKIVLCSHSKRNLSLRARDLLHPGIEDHNFIACEIYARLMPILL
jgi:hypothetical protein